MAHLTHPAVISGVSAGSFPGTAAGNRAYSGRGPSKPYCTLSFMSFVQCLDRN